MERTREAIPIKKAELNEYLERCNQLIEGIKWSPKKDVISPTKPDTAPGTPQWRDPLSRSAHEERMSIMQSARRVSNDQMLLPDTIHRALLAVRTGLQLGFHIFTLYGRAANLDTLMEQNNRGLLTDGQKTEFRSKQQTASAILLFALAYYVVAELEKQAGDTENISVEFRGIPEMTLVNPLSALQCALFYYGAYLEKSKSVTTEKEFVKMTLLYFRGILDELQLRKDALQYTEQFSSCVYKLEGSDFTLNGFETELSGGRVSVEFNRVAFEEMVGNRDAKHHAWRLSERLICYNHEEKRNPMFDLGGFTTVIMGHGKPGTGKSMLIAATATRLDELCRNLEVPFLFWQMPDTMISSFQGKSAENMHEWMAALKDPSRIVYAPIDDAENNLEERTRQGVSEGVRQLIGVFLRNTESASAIWRGNAVIALYTNIPDQIDKAIISRVQSRTTIDGAITVRDFVDQDYLWWKRYREIDPGFVNLSDPEDYPYLTDQKLVQSLNDLNEYTGDASEANIREAIHKVRERYEPAEHAFFGNLFAEILKTCPSFSSRDVRNIQKAVDMRIMDFDFPKEWFETPDEFFHKRYGEKRAMLIELMKSNMKGLSFAEIRYQETVRYLEEMIRITDKGRRRRIAEAREQMEIQKEARILCEQGGKS